MNATKFIKSLSLLLLPFLWMSCTKDDTSDPPANRTALVITGKVPEPGSMRAETRAIDSNWQQSDAIGVYMLNAGTATPTEEDAPAAGYKYINKSADGPTATFAPADAANTAYFPSGKAQVDVIAYYPYNPSAGNTGAGTLPVNVSDQSNLPAIDLMTSALSTGHSSESPEVALAFKHRLAKVVVKISGATGDVTALSITGTPATATYDLMEQKITGRGEATDIELSTLNSQLSTNIVVPTIAGSGVQFKLTAGGRDYTAALPAHVALEAGKVTTVTITLSETEVEITATITDWEGGTGTLDTAINFTIPEHNDEASLGILQLWKMNSNVASATVTYNWNGSKWATAGTPFYVEDIASGDAFYARHTPVTGSPITGTPDVLTAGPATASTSGQVALQFNHAMSQVEFILDRGAGFTEPVTGGTVEITLKKDYTFAPDNSMTVGSTSAIYTLKQGEVYTVVPQVVAASAIIVKLNGHTYKVSQGITFAAGDKVTVTLTLLPTETGITVEAGTWNTVSGSATAKQDIQGNLTATNLSGDGELTVSTGTDTGVYTYTHSTQALTVKSPLYWDDLSGSAFNFAAVFTPTAAGTPEKDVLSGSATSVAYGTLIDFGKLTHNNARLKITLTAGTGYTAADMQATTLSVTGLTATAYAINAGQEYIFKPKTFVATDVITITTPLETYTLKMSDIKVNGSSLTALAAGSSYTVNLTVSKSHVVVSIDVKDWEDVGGTGSVGY